MLIVDNKNNNYLNTLINIIIIIINIKYEVHGNANLIILNFISLKRFVNYLENFASLVRFQISIIT